MRKKKVCNFIKLPGILSLQLHYPLVFSLILLFTFPGQLQAQNPDEYYEISVNLQVRRIGGTELEAVIKDKKIYLSVSDLFDFLKIKNTPAPGLESVSGFFIEPSAGYEIDRIGNKVHYKGKTYPIEPGGIIKTESHLFLKSSYFGEIFGLNCIFNFRALSVDLETQLELPLIREMRQEEIRKNLSRLNTGQKDADTLIGRTYPLFKFGRADWAAIASEEINGRKEARLNLTLGSVIAGGEATASINYDSRRPFSEKQQYYMWRYVNNNHRLLRQVRAGKIAATSHSTIFNPVVGVQLTNTPTTYRRSFGTYRLSDRTEPGWIVELYVNNVLVDYVKADASGFFSFDVPLVYGNTIVNLKFYGPWGEEQTREQNITIPYNYLPEKTLEYNLSAGFVQDGNFSKFTRADMNYGLSKRITLGAGVEYLSSLASAPLMPFVNSSVRITNNLLMSGEYVHEVKAGGTMSLRLPSNIQLDLEYTNYDKDQEAISYNYLEQRRATLSIPMRIKTFSSYNRFSVNQMILPGSSYTTGEWMFSGSLSKLSTNIRTYVILIDELDPYIYSNLSLAFRLPWRLTIMPQLQYGYTKNKLLSAKLRIEKHLLNHAFLNLSFEKDFRSNMNLAELGLRYNFSFARTGASVRHSHGSTSMVQYARGSLISDPESGYRKADRGPAIGRGGIIIKPFFDYNANGKRDKGENAVPGLNLRANAGRVDKSEQDTIIAIRGLEPYTSCYIELDPNSFYNIAWRLPYESLSVKVDANIMKNIDIPVTVAGEASGFVKIEHDSVRKGLGRIIMHFFSENNKKEGTTITENDGYFSYFGLKPGKYYVMPDTAQLAKLEMQADPGSLNFTIRPLTDGDIRGDLDFVLRMTEPVSTGKVDITETDSISAETEQVIQADSSYTVVHELTRELLTISEDSWAIQLGAFTQKKYAEIMQKSLQELLNKDVEIVLEDDFYKVRILNLKTREEVDRNIEILEDYGIKIFWVINFKAKKQQLVLREARDSVLQVTERVTATPPVTVSPGMEIQIGAFRNKAYADALTERLSFKLDKDLVIIQEDGYHKVRIAGFKSVEEMEKIIPSLGFLGINDIWMLPATETREAPEREDTRIAGTDRIRAPRLGGIKTDTDLVKEGLQIEEPAVSLQVGLYPKRIQAVRAKRKIENKLNRNVEIIEQWDYYRVIVTGFFTPEETYPYYPKLAGMGFDNITLIDNREK